MPSQRGHQLLGSTRLHIEVDGLVPAQLEAELERVVVDAIREGKIEIPPLPKVALELQRQTQAPIPDLGRCIQLIKRDPQLAARVIQLANTAGYRPSGSPIRTLERAGVTIGLRGLRDMAFAFFLGRVFSCGPLDPLVKAQQRHAFVVACATAYTCGLLGLDSEFGFLCGLLHDVGRLAIFATLADLGLGDRRWIEPSFAERPFRSMHQRLGGLLLDMWGLPALTADAARYHHDPGDAGHSASMAFAVAVADAHDHGVVEGSNVALDLLCELPAEMTDLLTMEEQASVADLIRKANADPAIIALSQ